MNMKLTKQKLIKAVRTHLEEIGFTFFKTYEEDIVFAKRIRKGLYLTLFLTIHRFYNDQFTGDFTIAPTMHYLSTGGLYPKKMRERVGMLLTKQERMKYADEIETECHDENRSIDPAITKMMQELGLSTTSGEFKDCWWKGLENESVLKFLCAINLTEPRFVNNSSIVDELQNNIYIQQDIADQEKVIAYLEKVRQYNDYHYIPTRCLCAPIEWYQAVELLLIEKNKNPKNCKNSVRYYAENAYRVYTLETSGSSI